MTTKVNTIELFRILSQIKTPVPATITALTDVKMNKKDNPYFGRVKKESIVNVFINHNYQNAVNKRLLKEGQEANFEAKPRAWGQKLPGTPIVLHNDKYYLSAGFLTKNKPKTSYLLDGELVEKEVIQNYLPKVNEKPQEGLEEPVIERTYALENIKEIKVGGNVYEVVN